MKCKRTLNFLLALCLFALAPAFAAAENSKSAGDSIAAAGGVPAQLGLTADELRLVRTSQGSPVSVGLIASSAPVCYWNDVSGEYDGIFPELMRLISKKTGLRFKFVDLDLKKASCRLAEAGDARPRGRRRGNSKIL